MQRLEIGADCLGRWREEEAKAVEAAWAAIPRRAEIDLLHAAATAAAGSTVEERKDWLSTYEADNHKADLVGELREAEGLADDDERQPTRQRFVKVTRPYRRWAAIFEQVAEHYSSIFGVTISRRMVERCKKEVRKRSSV